MAIYLSDDGTMDTVLACDICGEEFRFNYDGGAEDATEDECAAAYDAWVDEIIAETSDEHECSSDEPTEPAEDDITTTDHEKFYQYGRLVLSHASNGAWYRHDLRAFPAGVLIGHFEDDHVAAVRAFMERSQFWPNVWFISDHGNAHLMDLSGE